MKKIFLTLTLFSVLFLAVSNTALANCFNPSSLGHSGSVVPETALLFAKNIGQTSATLSWARAKSASKYQVQVTGFWGEDFEVRQSSVRTNSYQIEGLTPGHDYIFRFRAFDAKNGWNPWSEEQELTTEEPKMAEMGPEIWASSVGQTEAELNWAAPKSAEKYQVQVSGFWDEDFEVRQSSATKNSFQLENLTPGHDYVFRFRAFDGQNDWGPWSEEQELTTEERSKPAEKLAAFEVSTYPNPATDFVQIKINSEELAARQLTLVSAGGQTVRSAFLNEGQDSHVFQVDDLATGLYFLRTETAGKIQVQKVVVSH